MTSSTAPRLWPRLGAALAALLIGGVIYLVLYGSILPGDPTSVPAVDAARITLFMLADLFLGLVAVALLPWALSPNTPAAGPAGSRTQLHPGAAAPRGERRGPLVAGLVIVAATAVSSLATPACVLVLVSFMTRRRALWIGLVAALFLAAARTNLALFPLDSAPVSPLDMALLGAVLGVCLLIGSVRRSRRDRVVALQQEAAATRRAHEATVREQAARLDRARIAERTRIAREMHDTLSHRLSLISVHAGALEYREGIDPAALRTTAGTIREAAGAASEELRDVLTVLRSSSTDTAPLPVLTDLAALLESTRAAGTPVTLESDPPLDSTALRELPDLVSRTVFRIVQECLTNAGKHAPGRPVTVQLARDSADGEQEDRIVVTVTNDLAPDDLPPDAPPPVPGSRLGLIGLRERAALLGGTFRADRTDNRFVVRAELPWPS